MYTAYMPEHTNMNTDTCIIYKIIYVCAWVCVWYDISNRQSLVSNYIEPCIFYYLPVSVNGLMSSTRPRFPNPSFSRNSSHQEPTVRLQRMRNYPGINSWGELKRVNGVSLRSPGESNGDAPISVSVGVYACASIFKSAHHFLHMFASNAYSSVNIYACLIRVSNAFFSSRSFSNERWKEKFFLIKELCSFCYKRLFGSCRKNENVLETYHDSAQFWKTTY